MAKVILPKWCSVVRTNPAAYEKEVFANTKIRSPRDLVDFVKPTLSRSEVELFVAVSLNTQHHVMGLTVVSRGTVSSSLVHARETFRTAIALGASALVLAHNHPSGDPTPSVDDKSTTDALVAAGAILEIPIFDHIIIAGERYTSFAEAGLL